MSSRENTAARVSDTDKGYTDREKWALARLRPAALQRQAPMRSRCDVTMDAIKSYILKERLQPGDLLPTEARLCEAVGASRSSVREAVRKLEALNIVNVEHGKGTFVGSLSLDPLVETLAFRSMVSVGKNFADLQDVVELRRFLDLGCAEEVCKEFEGTQQPELSALADSMVVAAGRGEDFLHADIDFHMGLLAPLGNTVAKQMVHSLWLVHMAVLPQLGLAPSEKMLDTAEAHRHMLAAAVKGDAHMYREAVREHYRPIESILRERMPAQ